MDANTLKYSRDREDRQNYNNIEEMLECPSKRRMFTYMSCPISVTDRNGTDIN